jgi:hypothetical protein
MMDDGTSLAHFGATEAFDDQVGIELLEAAHKVGGMLIPAHLGDRDEDVPRPSRTRRR